MTDIATIRIDGESDTVFEITEDADQMVQVQWFVGIRLITTEVFPRASSALAWVGDLIDEQAV